MKHIVLIIFTALLFGCKGGGGSGVEQAKPIVDPEDPNITWFKANANCTEVIEDYIWVTYSEVTDTMYKYDNLNYCENFPSNNVEFTRGNCITVSSFLYGAHELCFSEETEGLVGDESAWLRAEFLGFH